MIKRVVPQVPKLNYGPPRKINCLREKRLFVYHHKNNLFDKISSQSGQASYNANYCDDFTATTTRTLTSWFLDGSRSVLMIS